MNHIFVVGGFITGIIVGGLLASWWHDKRKDEIMEMSWTAITQLTNQMQQTFEMARALRDQVLEDAKDKESHED